MNEAIQDSKVNDSLSAIKKQALFMNFSFYQMAKSA